MYTNSMWLLTIALAIFCSWVGSRDVFYETTQTHLEQQVQVFIDRSKIQYGDFDLFDEKRMDKVGVMRIKEVYEEIPQYKTIKKEGVTEGSARWQQLMQEATESYKQALKTVAQGTYVLLVEEGGVTGYSTTDVTKDLIKQVKG